MPLYEYRCQKCRRRFSLLVGVTAEKAPLRCPRCGSGRATKLVSRIARGARGDDFDDSDLDDMAEGLDNHDEGYDDDFED